MKLQPQFPPFSFHLPAGCPLVEPAVHCAERHASPMPLPTNKTAENVLGTIGQCHGLLSAWEARAPVADVWILCGG